MNRQQALDHIQAAIATFTPIPIPQEALSQIERTLELFEAHEAGVAYRAGYDDGFTDGGGKDAI